jgi:protein phosphatase 1G
MYQKAFPEVSKQCGSTAVICLIIGSQLVCINLGDARSVLSRNGKAFDMSVDYKASRKDEQERIKSQGGYIVFGRVLGRLAVTRAFGDFECKQI